MSERFSSYEQPNKRESPDSLRKGMQKAIDLFCNEFSVEGKEGIDQALRENPNAKFVLAASHFSNLDAPAAVVALGDILDIQITAESVLFEGLAPQRALFGMVGKASFTPLSYEKGKGGKHGVFDPDDFVGLSQKVEEGKTPWIAIHPFTREEKMQKARIGAVYLAHKSGATIIPTALEYQGGSISLEGGAELFKALRKRKEGKGTYHVGKPIELLPLDVSIIEDVIKRQRAGEGKNISKEGIKKFSAVIKRLREDADTIANKIASMLPEDRQGPYQDTPTIELTDEDLKSLMVP